MSELEILYGIAENFKEKKVFDVEMSVDVFHGTHQAIKCRNNFYKNNETGIVKVVCDSNIDTEDLKCTHKINNETNLKGLCSKLSHLKKGDKPNIFGMFEDFIDFSVILSLLNSLEVEQNEDDSALVTIDLQTVANDLAEDDFDCFSENANKLIVSIIKLIINDIKSEKYDSILLKGHVDEYQELNKIEIIGDGKHKINVSIISK